MHVRLSARAEPHTTCWSAVHGRALVPLGVFLLVAALSATFGLEPRQAVFGDFEQGVGLLYDEAGRDTFLSRGLAPSLESDSILRSRCQGFGEEGVGVLVSSGDVAEFSAGTEAQGCVEMPDASGGVVSAGEPDAP